MDVIDDDAELMRLTSQGGATLLVAEGENNVRRKVDA